MHPFQHHPTRYAQERAREGGRWDQDKMKIRQLISIVPILFLVGCTRPAQTPEIQIEIRGTPQAPQYYIAGTQLHADTLIEILNRGRNEMPDAYVTIYSELSDAPTATREIIQICQKTGYKRIDIRLESPPPRKVENEDLDIIYEQK